MSKQYIITSTRPMSSFELSYDPMTLEQAIKRFANTLECSLAGNVNKTPKTIKSLVSNLTKASKNRSADGIGYKFSYVEFFAEIV